jgi:predicted RNA-binding Zn ribbon-like protein
MRTYPPYSGYSGCGEDLDESSAPGGLELVRRFINTLELENESLDQLDSIAGLEEFIDYWELPAGKATEADRKRAVELREALRELIEAEDGAGAQAPAYERVNAALSGSSLGLRFAADGTASLQPEGKGVDAAFAAIGAAIREAMIAGDWERLKVCASDQCRWAFYDRSRNHSRAWCRMQECGNRAKVRAYRERRSEG